MIILAVNVLFALTRSCEQRIPIRLQDSFQCIDESFQQRSTAMSAKRSIRMMRTELTQLSVVSSSHGEFVHQATKTFGTDTAVPYVSNRYHRKCLLRKRHSKQEKLVTKLESTYTIISLEIFKNLFYHLLLSIFSAIVHRKTARQRLRQTRQRLEFKTCSPHV